MEIESIRHRGLRRFFETGDARGLIGDADRLRKMLAFIDAAEDVAELATPPNYGLHSLTGNRRGTWSMIVTKNWRLTFPFELGRRTDRRRYGGLPWHLRFIPLSPFTPVSG